MEKTRETLPELEFLPAAASLPAFLKPLKAEFGRQAKPLIAAFRDGHDHGLLDEATDLVWDTFENNCDVLATFTAEGGCGEYPIVVKGIAPLCFVWASEFGKTGPFRSVADAEAFIRHNWTDSLVVSASHGADDLQPQDEASPISNAPTPLEAMALELDAHLRRQRRFVTGKESTESSEFIATFPQGRRPGG